LRKICIYKLAWHHNPGSDRSCN